MSKKNNIRTKYILITIGILGLIPFGFPLFNNFFFSYFHNNEDTRFTIFYSVVILCFISGTYWGLSLRLEEKKGDEFSYILALITLFPFSLAFLSLILINDLSYIILLIGFLICYILDEILYKMKYIFYWYILLRRFLTVVVVSILFYYYIFNNV